MAAHQIEPDNSTATATEHIRRFILAAQFLKQTVGIVAVSLDPLLLLRVIERALREPPAIIGDDTISVNEMTGNSVEGMSITPSSRDEKQERAFSAHLIGKSRSRHAQSISFRTIYKKSLFHFA
jgi:hypothetical protein